VLADRRVFQSRSRGTDIAKIKRLGSEPAARMRRQIGFVLPKPAVAKLQQFMRNFLYWYNFLAAKRAFE
jgi:hypothetical protein